VPCIPPSPPNKQCGQFTRSLVPASPCLFFEARALSIARINTLPESWGVSLHFCPCTRAPFSSGISPETLPFHPAGMASSRSQAGYHGGNKNPDEERYQRYLDILDGLFPSKSPTRTPAAPNKSKFRVSTLVLQLKTDLDQASVLTQGQQQANQCPRNRHTTPPSTDSSRNHQTTSPSTN
jgi:hypothetical protein